MKPQTEAFLAAASRALSKAHRILAIDIPDTAAREAYFAQFHAAQALIFERADKIAKSHKGVNREFHRLAQSESTFPPDLAGTLSVAYLYKDSADYDTSPTPVIGTSHDAQDAIATAERFVAAVQHALDP